MIQTVCAICRSVKRGRLIRESQLLKIRMWKEEWTAQQWAIRMKRATSCCSAEVFIHSFIILTKRICKCLMQIADLRQNPTAHASLHYPANLSNMLEKGITENKYIIRIQAVITSTQSAATHRNYSLHRAEENKILRCCSKNSRTTTNYTYRGYDFLLRCSRKSEIGWSANPTRWGSEYEKPK